MAPQALVHLADSILYLSSLLRDQPRSIDRHIDYFGGSEASARSVSSVTVGSGRTV